MSSGPIATASVKIIPDLTGFQALLQTEVNKAVAGVKVPPIAASVSAAGTAAAGGIRTSTGKAGAAAAGGVNALTKESQALRGTLIGLSRVTPVTVFGLGVYGTAAIAAGYAIKGAIRSTADFEHQLNILQATTGATADQMQAITAESKALGADLSLPATSAGDAARAMTELAKAGLSVEDTLAGARGVLQLAAAAQIDVGSAAEFVATELNAFALSGENATHVADLLAGASIAAQGDIRDFGTAFQQVSAVAHGANVSLETTTGLLTELARAGLRGADAGTSIRTFLLRLTPTTKQAAQYQEALNIRLDQTKTIGEQLPGLIGQYQRALSALTPIQQQQALTQIFGQDAIRAATILIHGGTQALQENTDAANQNGAAARLAAANAKGLSGAFNGLKSNLDTLGITLGGFVKGPLTELTTTLSEGIGLVNDFADKLGSIKIPQEGNLKKLGVFLLTAPPPLRAAKFARDTLGVGKKSDYQKAIEAATAQRNADNKAAAAAAIAAAKGVHDESARANAAAAKVQAAITDASDRRNPPATLSTAEKAAVQAHFRALQKSREKAKATDVTTPIKLENARFQAQLDDNLQEELKADRGIEAYFRKRLKLAEGKPKVYNAVLQALTQAHAATQSVLGQIKSEGKAAQQQQQSDITDAISLQRTRLENAAELSDHQGEAERKLIAFYLAESKDLRLEASARLAYEAAYNAEVKAQRAATVTAAKAEIDRRNALFDLRIQQAELTPGVADENRVRQKQINYIKGLRSHTKKLSDEWIKYSSDIATLQAAIKGSKDQANGGGSGFSLNDLFKEAVNQLNEFGSNVSSSITTGGGARAAVAGGILSRRPEDRTDAVGRMIARTNDAQLTEQERTNQLLSGILQTLAGPTGNGGTTHDAGRTGETAFERARRLGKATRPF